MAIGTKRKADSWTRSGFSSKVAKTATRGGPSTPALNVIDDRCPDITLVDVPVDEDLLAHPYGRHGCLYMEVKVEADKKPNPQGAVSVPFRGYLLLNDASGQVKKKPGKKNKGALQSTEGPTIVKSILRQIADIAHLHLATRPFMRYSLHITVCGTIFNICLFDQAGGVVSKDYDLKRGGDFETFVRIIRRATCDMDAYELGLDPTVTPPTTLALLPVIHASRSRLERMYTTRMDIPSGSPLHCKGAEHGYLGRRRRTIRTRRHEIVSC